MPHSPDTHLEEIFHHSESDTGVFYRFRPAIDDRRYLVVVLSGFRDPVHSVDFVGGAASIRANLLWIYDDFDGMPGYYYWGKNKHDVSLAVHCAIDEVRRKLGIPQSNVVLFGLSKGANAALLFAAEYGYSKIVASAPRAYNGSSMRRHHKDVFEHIRNGNLNPDYLAEILDSELERRVSADRNLDKSIFVFTSPADSARYLTESVALSVILSKYTNFQLIQTKSDLVYNHIQVSKYNLPLYISIITQLTEGLTPSFTGETIHDAEFERLGGDLTNALGNGALNNRGATGAVSSDLLSVEDGELEARALHVSLTDVAVMKVSGYAIMRGAPHHKHGLSRLRLLLDPTDSVQDLIWLPLGSIKDSSLSARLYSGRLVDYSFGGFATLQERGVKLSEVPFGQYSIKLQMSRPKNASPKVVPLRAPALSIWVCADDRLIGLESDGKGANLFSRPLVAEHRQDVFFELIEFSLDQSTLFVEGYFVPKGITIDRWDSITYYLVLERAMRDGNYQVAKSFTLSNGNKKDAGTRCGEPWRDQSKAYFATRDYRGINLSELLPGKHRVTVTARCGDDVFSHPLDEEIVVRDDRSPDEPSHPVVSVIGSCVSRDNFNTLLSPNWKDYWRLGPVFYQSSLVSLMASPVEVGVSIFSDLDAHSRDVTKADFTKNFLSDLAQSDPEIVLVDLFADVRFGTIQVGNSWVTNNEWKLTRSSDFMQLALGSPVNMLIDPEHYLTLFKDACIRFAAHMRTHLPKSRVVLNRARNIELHRGLNKQGGKFHQKLIREWNDAWVLLDDVFYKHCGAVLLDSVNFDLQGAGNHPGGPGPVHYEKDYYNRFHANLFAVLNRQVSMAVN